GMIPKLNRSRPPAVWHPDQSPTCPKETLMRTRMILLGVTLLAATAACGHKDSHPAAAPAPQKPVGVQVEQSSLGPILTDQNGRTLSAFTADKGGTSSCSGECIATWPALVSQQPVAAGTGADKALLSQTSRTEGTVQATYGDWPLYYYVGDQGPGDVD